MKKYSLLIMMITAGVLLQGCVAQYMLLPYMDEAKSLQYQEAAEASGVSEDLLIAIDQARYGFEYKKAKPNQTVELFVTIEIERFRKDDSDIFIINSYADYVGVAKDLGLPVQSNMAEAIDQFHTLSQNKTRYYVVIKYKTLEQVMDNLNFTKDQREIATAIGDAKVSLEEESTVEESTYKLTDYKNMKFVHPSPDAKRISSNLGKFGWRIHPVLKIRKFHRGIDLTSTSTGNSYGLPTVAIYDGYVSDVGFDETSGNFIFVNHIMDNKKIMRCGYMHLSKIGVAEGTKVKRGDIIGNIGSTGLSTGAHLHFSVTINGVLVNPENVINQ